jgi:DNA-binding HxlR family transcriptional regulator
MNHAPTPLTASGTETSPSPPLPPGEQTEGDETLACCTEGTECHPAQNNDTKLNVHDVIGSINDKWTMHVVCHLKNGPQRFNELKRGVTGISQRMLAVTLRCLERDGLVSRTVSKKVPPHVIYALTALGRTLISPVSNLFAWVETHLNSIADARKRFDSKDDRSEDQ